MTRQQVIASVAFALALAVVPGLRAEADVQGTLHLNPVKDLYPYWSPDGEHIVFHSNRLGGAYQLFVMRADGSGLKPLTNPAINDCFDQQ